MYITTALNKHLILSMIKQNLHTSDNFSHKISIPEYIISNNECQYDVHYFASVIY